MQALAGERLADVYVGVDVFARGNVVGGRFDTDKVGSAACVPGFVADLLFPSAPSGEREVAVILARMGKLRH